MENEVECISVLPWNNEGNNSNYISWNNLISVVCDDHLFIAQWNERQVSLFRVNEREVRKEGLSALNSAVQLCQDIRFPESVMQVFGWTSKLFLLTTTGFLKVLNFDESTIRYLKENKICFKTIHYFNPPKKLLKAYPLIRNVLLLATDLHGCISIDIYNVDTLSDELEVSYIDSLLLENQEHQDGEASVVMCKCNTTVASQLVGTQSENFIVMLVGLNSGAIYWLAFLNNTAVLPEVRKLYHAGRKVREIISPKGISDVFVLLEGGVVVLITCSATSKDKNSENIVSSSKMLNFDIFALPGSIREFCVSPHSRSILCTDGTRCWLVKEYTEESEQTLLPLVGVTGLLAITDSNICLATTKHNTYYTVNVASNFDLCGKRGEPSTQKYCDLETPYQYICELKEKTNGLLEVERALEVEDSVLAAISAASRGEILQQSFSGRVLVHNVEILDPFEENIHHPPTNTSYKVSIEVKNNSTIEFPASLWNMCISISTCDEGVLSKTVSLQSSFSRTCPFSTNVFIRLHSKDLVSELGVVVNLIANLPEPDEGRWISIPVMEENLDLSYFVTVISDAEKGGHKTKPVPIEHQICELLGKEPMDRQRVVSYSINIPQHLRDVSDLMRSLLLKCKHRCEEFLKQIKGGTEQREFTLLFGDAVVTITFNRTISVLIISSNNIEMVHSVKVWIIRHFSTSSDQGATPADVVSKAKWLQCVLEKEQSKLSIDVDHLKEIHGELRNNVSAALLF